MNNKETTRKAHNKIAKQYYKIYKDDKSDLAYFDEFLSVCGKEILDLGCGMGHYSKYIKNKGHEVTGVDFSKEMIKIAKKTNSGIKFHVSDICDLKVLKKQIYDGVVIAYVLQHMSKDEVSNMFSQLEKHVKLGSKLLLFIREGEQVLVEEEPLDNSFKYIINEYTKEEMTEVLSKYGWNVVSIRNKPKANDPYSLIPNTLVVMADRRN